MAKKIKLPLEMANGVAVRTIEELKENWDLEKIVSYYRNGRLLTWLNDRYYDEQAEQVQALDKNADAHELQKQLCSVFEVPFAEEETVDIEAIALRNEKLNKLRKLTSDDTILKNVDIVAFNQEELADLLDEDESVIYLADNTFNIPLTVKNKKYIGVGVATAVIKSKQAVEFEKLGIIFENIKFDKKYSDIANPDNFLVIAKKYFNQNNYSDAVKWFRKAADLGNVEAMLSLGMCYIGGKGVKQDDVEVMKWLRKAAELGDAFAMEMLASGYSNGKGVKKDDKEAAVWYRKAAEQGRVDAMNSIGDCYRYGNGVDEDATEAVKWYRKAAEQGHIEAQKNLGWMYVNGYGVMQDDVEAVKLRSKGIPMHSVIWQ